MKLNGYHEVSFCLLAQGSKRKVKKESQELYAKLTFHGHVVYLPWVHGLPPAVILLHGGIFFKLRTWLMSAGCSGNVAGLGE